MLDALTASQFAMQMDQLKLQTISQNVANMNTPGFKRQLLESRGFAEQLQANLSEVLTQTDASQIKTQGIIAQSHNPADFAIAGEGYFQVQGDQGVFYTRRGDFHINAHGELTTATGETVLGKSGVIRVDDSSFTVDAQGTIVVDHRKIDQLNVVQFEHTNDLRYVGNGLYQSEQPANPVTANTRIMQGFIEQSNVKSVDEMMDMVKLSRHFEASQRVMRLSDNLLSNAINQLGEGNV